MKVSPIQKNMCNSKGAQSIGEEIPETVSSKTFLSMLTDIAMLKSEVSAIKGTYMLSAIILMLLSKKLQTKITSHRYAHFVLYYIFFFALICFNNYALF